MLPRFGHPFQFRNARFDVLDLDGLGRVAENGFSRPHLNRRRRGRIDHHLQQCRGRRRRSLLQPCDGLPVRFTASLTICGQEPAQRGLAIARELADRPNATQEQVYNFAWLGMTVEPADLRDPRTVLPYALKAVQMSGGTDEFSLYNLAETYAAMGDYAKAVETGEKAAALFPPLPPGQPRPSQQETIENSLKEYRDVLAKRKR